MKWIKGEPPVSLAYYNVVLVVMLKCIFDNPLAPQHRYVSYLGDWVEDEKHSWLFLARRERTSVSSLIDGKRFLPSDVEYYLELEYPDTGK